MSKAVERQVCFPLADGRVPLTHSHVWQVPTWFKFRAIMYEDLLWRSLYTHAIFPRALGPAPSQSQASLE
jgi:hypothetical protein